MASKPFQISEEAVANQSLSTREKIILLEGSKLHGCLFPPWTTPGDSDFKINSGQSMFIDDANYSFSENQLNAFEGWRRPNEVLPPRGFCGAGQKGDNGPTMVAVKPSDLVQDITTDCSVVASLCAGSARVSRGHSEIVSSLVYPFNHSSKCPARSENGKYVFRFQFNGCWRRVVIDDRLPASNPPHVLHVFDRNNPGLLWPALIEKAYLKVRGGYDFPGSNSGSDLWILTGWIPEQLFLQGDETDRVALWRRILTAFNYGDVLVTLGTGRMSPTEEQDTGLVGKHDFAIMDLRENQNARLLLVKNPWSGGTTWRSSSVISNILSGDNGGSVEADVSEERSSVEDLVPGTFWMTLNDVFQNFESMYLNWNPKLFSHKEDVHFRWDLAGANPHGASFGSNPQYLISIKGGGTAWLLLSRHFRSPTINSGTSDEERILPRSADEGFISLYAFHDKGSKIYLADDALVRGPYVDSPNTLLKLELEPSKKYIIVVSEQGLARSKYNFTMSVFSLKRLSLSEAHDKYLTRISRHGAWNPSTAGGNASSASYHLNPQFGLTLSQNSDISLLLQLTSGNTPVNVKVIWSNGRRVGSITTRDVLADSGEYRKGHAFIEIRDVPAGRYTVVCSTFECGQLGSFTLQISSMSEALVERLPIQQAGRFVSHLPTGFFEAGKDRLSALLRCDRLTRLSLVARARSCERDGSTRKGIAVPLRVALECGRGSMKQILATSGDDEFCNGQQGVRIDDVDIQPRMCNDRGVWIVLERLGYSDVQSNEGVDVEIASESACKVDAWVQGERSSI